MVNVYGKGAARLHQVRVKETSVSKLLMRHRNRSSEGIKTGAPPLSGKSMVVTYLLAMRCPVYKQRDFHLGFHTELENWIGVAREKVQAVAPRGRKYQYAGQGRTAS